MSDRDSRYHFGPTRWSVVRAAGQKDAAAARSELLVRYHEVVNKYLLDWLNDSHAADEVYSDYTKRVLEGASFLEQADPKKGKFRHYLREILRNMVIDYLRKKKKDNEGRRALLPGGKDEPVATPDEPAYDEAKCRGDWVQMLRNRAWKALAEDETPDGPLHYAVLVYQSQNEKAHAPEIAEYFTTTKKRPLTAPLVRKYLERGRAQLADLLVREVALECADGEERPPAERVEEELNDLGLLKHKNLRKALERYRRGCRGEAGQSSSTRRTRKVHAFPMSSPLV
jgi:RNA polymerase sigma factor (sigma-70 family)